MKQVYPNYYTAFSCIKGACRHSCCIGWEIDIDPDTLARYEAVGGGIGARLRESISYDGDPHFILGDGERCPFLNREGLCDVILTLGEAAICEICREHPRFHNVLPGRTESGLGLCCEAAARLILGQREPTSLVTVGEDGAEDADEILTLRDGVITLLQDRTKPIRARIGDMLALCGAAIPERTLGEWTELFLSLERLDERWTELLLGVKARDANADSDVFDAYMAERQTEYEQLLVYLIYRHFANAFDREEAAEIAAWAALSYELIHALGASIFYGTGRFDLDDHVLLVRLFSSEIEYCEENVEALRATLSADGCTQPQ